MSVILHLLASPRGSASHSARLSNELVERLCQRDPAARVIVRDLAATPPPVANSEFSAAILEGAHSEDPAFALSEALIRELEACDQLVIATPMHNFGIPAVLKAWVDQIVRIRRTFASTPTGKIGLLPDRPAWLIVASGGWFTQTSPIGAPPQPDFLTSYLRTVLATIGLQRIEVVALEGVTRSPAAEHTAYMAARARLDALLTPVPGPSSAQRADRLPVGDA